jgi:hypothetical protein
MYVCSSVPPVAFPPPLLTPHSSLLPFHRAGADVFLTGSTQRTIGAVPAPPALPRPATLRDGGGAGRGGVRRSPSGARGGYSAGASRGRIQWHGTHVSALRDLLLATPHGRRSRRPPSRCSGVPRPHWMPTIRGGIRISESSCANGPFVLPKRSLPAHSAHSFLLPSLHFTGLIDRPSCADVTLPGRSLPTRVA